VARQLLPVAAPRLSLPGKCRQPVNIIAPRYRLIRPSLPRAFFHIIIEIIK
jgi:hypothetical protein